MIVTEEVAFIKTVPLFASKIEPLWVDQLPPREKVEVGAVKDPPVKLNELEVMVIAPDPP